MPLHASHVDRCTLTIILFWEYIRIYNTNVVKKIFLNHGLSDKEKIIYISNLIDKAVVIMIRNKVFNCKNKENKYIRRFQLKFLLKKNIILS